MDPAELRQQSAPGMNRGLSDRPIEMSAIIVPGSDQKWGNAPRCFTFLIHLSIENSSNSHHIWKNWKHSKTCIAGMPYRSLNPEIQEIRLVTVLPAVSPANSGDEYIVQCSLEYVSLAVAEI